MNAFKRKSIYLAVVAGMGAVGVAGSAAAVTVSQTGTGEVLIYPYYSVRNGNETYISVTNTTASAKAVKVRFLEGKNSREVLDFNLYLSANDMWTGAVVATADGAKLVTTDKSCSGLPTGGASFVNYAYGGTDTDTGAGIIPNPTGGLTGDFESKSLDRTREGYFEIIEMGEIVGGSALETAVTHVQPAGVPANCAVANALTAGTSMLPPTGGLAGNASLMNVAIGTDASFDPVALSAFSDAVIWFEGGSIHPDMTDVSPNTSTVFKNGAAVTSTWARASGSDADPVSAVLMHDRLMNDFVLDTATLSGTDWVITMPTKRHYVAVDDDTTLVDVAAITPFTKAFKSGGSCESFSLAYYNREEGSPTTPTSNVSPLPPGVTGSALCWESTILTFNNSDVLGSTNKVNQAVDSAYQNGWARISFNGASNTMDDGAGHIYTGLPAIGFMVQDFVNQNAAPGIMATYAGNFIHKYRTNITGTAAPLGE
ncbi:MAG: hypothetical protein ACYC2E_09005 [Sulfuricella sp.]